MQRILLTVGCIFCLFLVSLAQEEKINLVIIGAHPDDADIKAGGTAAEFARRGHNVLMVSVTNGDAGHHEMGGAELARIRKDEAVKAGMRLGVDYVVLDNPDGKLMPTLEVREQIIRLIREWNADIVMSHRPNDYHPDHRNTAILVQDAAYMVIVPNIVPDVPPLKVNPVFLFLEDRFQRPWPFQPDIAVDITSTFEQKMYALSAHESQFFDWLPWTAGRLEQVPEGEQERIAWLTRLRSPLMDEDKRASLIKWYGNERGSQIRFAEAFEICEYGRRPSEEEIRRLFPMLGN